MINGLRHPDDGLSDEAHYLQSCLPPVGSICKHRNPSLASLQNPQYRLDDNGRWIHYHGFYLVGSGENTRLEICGKPRQWQWDAYLRECGECGREISNPWVPVCEACWLADPSCTTVYPGWQSVIATDLYMKRGLLEIS